MVFIQQHQFLDSETFNQYQARTLRKVTSGLPENCKSIHFNGNRYDHKKSTKGVERQRRTSNKPQKEYEVSRTRKTPPFKEFMASKVKKAKLQDFLSRSWETQYVKCNFIGDLYISGTFLDEKRVYALHQPASKMNQV